MRLPVETVISRYQNSLFRIAYSLLKNTADAQDCVQNALIKYCQTEQDYENEEHLRAWLIRTTINLSKDLLRSFWRRNREDLAEYERQLGYEDPKNSRLFETVMGLPAKYRILLQLFYYEEYSVREIASLSGLSEAAVKTRLSRARKILKTRLTEDHYEF